jgi:chaperonin cofactor prefoldin
VGRMFLQQPLPELLGTLDVMMVKVDTQIDALDKKSKYIEKQIAEDEKNLNEIVQQIYAKQGPAK